MVFSGLEIEIFHFSNFWMVFIEFRKAFINFWMVFNDFYTVFINSFMVLINVFHGFHSCYIHFFHCFHPFLKRRFDFLLAFPFSLFFSMVFSDLSMMFIDFQCFMMFIIFSDVFIFSLCSSNDPGVHQCVDGAHGFSFIRPCCSLILHDYPFYCHGLQLLFNGIIHRICAGCSSMFPMLASMLPLFWNCALFFAMMFVDFHVFNGLEPIDTSIHNSNQS